MSDDITEIEVNVPVRIGLHLTPAELKALSAILAFVRNPYTAHIGWIEEADAVVAGAVLDAILQGAGFVKEDSGGV